MAVRWFVLTFFIAANNNGGDKSMYDVTIIGCGVIGASLAYTLSQYRLRVLVL